MELSSDLIERSLDISLQTTSDHAQVTDSDIYRNTGTRQTGERASMIKYTLVSFKINKVTIIQVTDCKYK